MMNASLDTDVVIHLYLSEKQGLFFEFFDELYMHEFLYEQELKKRSIEVYRQVSQDVTQGKIIIISNKKLIEMGVKHLFDRYMHEYLYLFDQGELYAVSLAKVLGLHALVTDDTKEFGPHENLVKERIKDVVPFAFYELLFLKYLCNELTVKEFHHEFDKVTLVSMRGYPMNFISRISRTVSRFSHNRGTKRDNEWINHYCSDKKIILNKKMKDLKEYLESI